MTTLTSEPIIPQYGPKNGETWYTVNKHGKAW